MFEPSILALSRDDKPYTAEKNACDKQVSLVLLQSHEDDNDLDLRPIDYWSRSLNDAELPYDITRKCLGVVCAVLLLRTYKEAKKFTVSTDYQALGWLLDIKDLTGRLARWQLRLMKYDFKVHIAPDGRIWLLTLHLTFHQIPWSIHYSTTL